MVVPPVPATGQTTPAPDTAVVESPSEPDDPISPAAQKQTLPYNWGKFQGWVSLIAGVFVVFFAIYSLTAGTMDETLTFYAIAAPLAILSGYSFIRRKKYAVAMTYVWMIFYGIIFLLTSLGALTSKALTPEQQAGEIGAGIGRLVPGLVFWGLCAVYYRKRRPEFN